MGRYLSNFLAGAANRAPAAAKSYYTYQANREKLQKEQANLDEKNRRLDIKSRIQQMQDQERARREERELQIREEKHAREQLSPVPLSREELDMRQFKKDIGLPENISPDKETIQAFIDLEKTKRLQGRTEANEKFEQEEGYKQRASESKRAQDFFTGQLEEEERFKRTQRGKEADATRAVGAEQQEYQKKRKRTLQERIEFLQLRQRRSSLGLEPTEKEQSRQRKIDKLAAIEGFQGELTPLEKVQRAVMRKELGLESSSLGARRAALTGKTIKDTEKSEAATKRIIVGTAMKTMELDNLKGFGFKSYKDMADTGAKFIKIGLEQKKFDFMKEKTKTKLSLEWIKFLQEYKTEAGKGKRDDLKLGLQFMDFLQDKKESETKMALDEEKFAYDKLGQLVSNSLSERKFQSQIASSKEGRIYSLENKLTSLAGAKARAGKTGALDFLILQSIPGLNKLEGELKGKRKADATEEYKKRIDTHMRLVKRQIATLRSGVSTAPVQTGPAHSVPPEKLVQGLIDSGITGTDLVDKLIEQGFTKYKGNIL